MGLQHYLQIFPSQLNTQFLLFITKIPCYYQILIFGGQEYNNWLYLEGCNQLHTMRNTCK